MGKGCHGLQLLEELEERVAEFLMEPQCERDSEGLPIVLW
jgi:hypothetical protein